MERKRFLWDVTLEQDGKPVEVEYAAFWSPEKVDPEFVARSCAAELRAQGAQVNAISAALRA